jgi:hypothetical protein
MTWVTPGASTLTGAPQRSIGGHLQPDPSAWRIFSFRRRSAHGDPRRIRSERFSRTLASPRYWWIGKMRLPPRFPAQEHRGIPLKLREGKVPDKIVRSRVAVYRARLGRRGSIVTGSVHANSPDGATDNNLLPNQPTAFPRMTRVATEPLEQWLQAQTGEGIQALPEMCFYEAPSAKCP